MSINLWCKGNNPFSYMLLDPHFKTNQHSMGFAVNIKPGKKGTFHALGYKITRMFYFYPFFLAFVTIFLKIDLHVQDQLADSGHRTEKLAAIRDYVSQEQKSLSRWNYKRADWDRFTMPADKCHGNMETRYA